MLKMQYLTEITALESETIEQFIKSNEFPGENDDKKARKTRSSLKKVLDCIVVDDVSIEKLNNGKVYRVSGTLKEIISNSSPLKGRKKKGEPEQKLTVKCHPIQTEINAISGNVLSACCTECETNKEKCPKMYAFLLWIQQKQKMALVELENVEDNPTKKVKRESNSDNTLKPVNINLESLKTDLPPLPKLKKEVAQMNPLELESAMKLSLFNLVQEYDGNDAQEFLQFCSKRMLDENCSKAQILTIEQADTDLWHELRKGRITASRIHEASRCTMLNGSLTSKIMGLSSGFSFAMKRGTDLEGYVFAELQKEYPSLKNTGLVLDPQFPWMGASPDGLSDDFVLEIKCPYTEKTHQCYIDVSKLSKKYFAQIQLQMHMTHRTKALLGVAALDFEKTRNVTKVWIDYDKKYVDDIMEEAFEFWRKGVFPALMKKRRKSKK